MHQHGSARALFLATLAVGGALLLAPAGASGVLTPEQRAGPTGQIPNPNAQEYYLGPIGPGDYTSGDIVGAVGGTLPSLVWYKYISDGSTPIAFDMFGSVFGFELGGFSGGPDGELALYDVNGHFIAGNEGVKGPANGDSNLPPDIPEGAPPAPVKYRQPRDPTRPVYEYSSQQSTWFARNNQGLPQLAFIPSPQSNPLWNPADPNYTPNADWSQYALLPAGTYFLAVTGYSTYFAGNPRDIATAGTDTENPFGFVSYHAMTGTYILNARRGGDLNLDSALNSDDVRTLIAKIRELARYRGIAPAGFDAGEWQRLPADLYDPGSELQRFDITGNSRIDLYDMGALGRYSGMAVPVFAQWAISGGGTWSASAPENWSGNGVPGGVDHAASFGTFDGTIAAPQTVTLAAPVTVGAINFDNEAAYTISAAAGATITLAVSLSPDAQLNVFAGSHTLAAPIVAASDTTINVLPPGSALAITGSLTATGRTLSKLGDGSLELASLRAGAMNITAGAVKMSAKAQANSAAGTSVINALTIGSGASLDLTNNSMILDYSGPAGSLADDFRQMLQGGRLISSSADSSRGIGYADNAALGLASFSGRPVDATSILVKYTYLGDTNLDGQVDVIDLGNLATRWQMNGVWANGDSNYDGFIDVIDLGLLATNWQAGVGSPLGPGSLAEALAAYGLPAVPVPEPAGGALLAAGLVAAAGRRRPAAH